MEGCARKSTRLLAIALLLALALPTPALAQGIVYGDTIPGGTVVDYDVVLVGQDVSIEGTVNGNVFILGNQVTVNGEVNGSLLVIGQNLTLGGTVTGGVYALGLTTELAPNASLERDLYALSVGIASRQDSSIQRDLFALALDASLNGGVGRDLHTAIGPIQLYNGLMRLLGFEELTIELHFELPKPAPGATPSSRILPAARARLRAQSPGEEAPWNWAAWGIDVTREWIVLSLFGLLAFCLARRPLEASNVPLRARPWRTTGIGLLALVIGFNLFALGALLGALVFSLGLALNYLGLWQLCIALWIAAYSLLALALTALWFFITYGAKIVLVYALFTWLSDKFNAAVWVKIAAFLLGAAVYTLLRSVPYVGWIVGVLVTAAGAGAAWLAWRASRQQPVEVEEAPKRRRKTPKSQPEITGE
jgi:cytoskeletal protein CcmA (bactofilin family)